MAALEKRDENRHNREIAKNVLAKFGKQKSIAFSDGALPQSITLGLESSEIVGSTAEGVKKFVLVSSILTNGRAWGQANSPGFQITNAFGGVLDEKIEAERALRASGLDFTIVRPGGLKATPPTGELIVAKEDTLNAGEVSRDLVADVCVAALFDGKSTNKVVEIIEGDGSPKLPESKWFA